MNENDLYQLRVKALVLHFDAITVARRAEEICELARKIAIQYEAEHKSESATEDDRK